jgi:NTE family protein
MGVGTTEFAITPDRAQQLFHSGQSAAEQFLTTWNFEDYKRRFRSGTPSTRRQSVH